MSDRMQWEKFWYRDFADDLRRSPLSVRGFWLFALMEMWSQGKSEIWATLNEWARICSCTATEVGESIKFLEANNICEVTYASNSGQDDVKLKNRRLKREEKAREYNRLAKRKERGIINGQGKVKNKSIKCPGGEEKKNRRIYKEPLIIGQEKTAAFFEKNCTDEQRHKIEVLTLELTPTWNTASKFVIDHILNAHPEAILYALNEVKNRKPEHPYQYAKIIIDRESKNFRAADFDKSDRENRVDFGEIVNNLKKLQNGIKQATPINVEAKVKT